MTLIDIPDVPQVPADIYFVEVKRIESTKARDGATQLILDLRDVETGEEILTEFLTFSTKTAIRIAREKLVAFGIPESQKTVDSDVLRGKRVYVALIESDYQGRKQMRADLKQGTGGYWNDDAPPAGFARPKVVELPTVTGEGADSTPF